MISAIDGTIEYIDHLAQRLEHYDPSSVAMLVLIQLRIPTQLHGFTYLQMAIVQRYICPVCSMSGDIYPAIRARFGDHLSNEVIEAAMRGAIQAGYKRGNLQLWKLLLPTVMADGLKRPSNTEFVDELARIVELLCSCARSYALRRKEEEAGYEIT